MVLGRPAPFDGAFVDPKWRRFDRMCRTERAEQPAISAISSSVGALSPCNLLSIMSFIRTYLERARFGAIIWLVVVVVVVIKGVTGDSVSSISPRTDSGLQGSRDNVPIDVHSVEASSKYTVRTGLCVRITRKECSRQEANFAHRCICILALGAAKRAGRCSTYKITRATRAVLPLVTASLCLQPILRD